MKLGKNQILLPSGVAVSKDGKYHYWDCSVSGLTTFAKPDYWVKIMAKFGSEENLVKTYVSKKAKALLDEGLTAKEIREKLTVPETRSDKVARKEIKTEKVRREKLTRVRRGKGIKSKLAKDSVVVKQEDGSVVVQVYPWQNDPTYFTGAPRGPMSPEEATKDACAFPPRYLDDECRGCPIHDRCKCHLRVDSAEWAKPKKKTEVVIKTIKIFDEASV